MKRCCKAKSIGKSAKRKITDREYKKRCCKAESIDVAATRKKVIRENMKDIAWLKVMMQLQHK